MVRPSKCVNTMSKHLTNEEKEARKENENILKGNSDKLIAPQKLSESQKVIFNNIISELEASEILGNLDIYILTQCAIAIDRLEMLEFKANEKPNIIFKKEFKSAKDTYDKVFYRCCSELSLSPQSRAKIGNINKDNQNEDPLLKALKG